VCCRARSQSRLLVRGARECRTRIARFCAMPGCSPAERGGGGHSGPPRLSLSSWRTIAIAVAAVCGPSRVVARWHRRSVTRLASPTTWPGPWWRPGAMRGPWWGAFGRPRWLLVVRSRDRLRWLCAHASVIFDATPEVVASGAS
jgi:hypothetical protein